MPNKTHNTEIKEITKESISTALFILMKKYDYGKITVTQIVEKAGVSRMAYYRNYETKDDIILNYLDSLFLQYCNEVMLSENGIDALYINFFSYFRKSGEFINLLIESKLSYLILEKFDEYVTYIKDTVFSAFIYEPVNVYELHYAAGGLYKTMIEWIRNGCTESDEYMAKTVKTLSNYKSSGNVL